MWIERKNKKSEFIQAVKSLKSQVLIVRGARQVGKTSFIVNALRELKEYPQVMINFVSKGRSVFDGVEYYGRDFFGGADAGQFFHNLNLTVCKNKLPVIVFIDEADRFPASLEAIQLIAARSDEFKVIFTGSNLENITVKNAATGRKRFFDLYPVTFYEFLTAYSKEKELAYLNGISLADHAYSEMYHHELVKLFDLYMRLGGMPRILDAFIDAGARTQPIPRLVSDLVHSIEENVKTVLGDKSSLYEYEDVLRKLAFFSMETLKFSRLQVQHAGRSEAKKLVNKTVGARVAHKIRLFDSGTDLSKYIIFDSGIVNYLLGGSDLLGTRPAERDLAIQYETAVGNEIIARLSSRDDLHYWKSARGAQVEFMLKSPRFMAIDVKSARGDSRSLDSCAVYEKDVEYIVKISKDLPRIDSGHVAAIPSAGLSRNVAFVTIPHYLTGRLGELI